LVKVSRRRGTATALKALVPARTLKRLTAAALTGKLRRLARSDFATQADDRLQYGFRAFLRSTGQADLKTPRRALDHPQSRSDVQRPRTLCMIKAPGCPFAGRLQAATPAEDISRTPTVSPRRSRLVRTPQSASKCRAEPLKCHCPAGRQPTRSRDDAPTTRRR